MTNVAITDALRQARAEIGSGNNSFVYVPEDGAAEFDQGPLAGTPIAVKDVMDCADMPTRHGTHDYVQWPETSATVVQRLVAAGARVVGKTNTHQFAFGTTCDVSAAGPVTNPADSTKMAGGSSGGSAVAVSRGIVPVALGTDTAGSVRIPASLVGCVGFKPTWQRLPADGVMPLSPSLDAVGVLTPTVEELRRVWPILSDNTQKMADTTTQKSLRFANLGGHPEIRLSSRSSALYSGVSDQR